LTPVVFRLDGSAVESARAVDAVGYPGVLDQIRKYFPRQLWNEASSRESHTAIRFSSWPRPIKLRVVANDRQVLDGSRDALNASPDEHKNAEWVANLAGYTYAGDDPVNEVDPTGLEAVLHNHDTCQRSTMVRGARNSALRSIPPHF